MVIEFDGKTAIIDRGGRRVRFYVRKLTDRPGMQERRRQRALGLGWCNWCKEWLPIERLGSRGKCRACQRAEDRDRFANSPTYRQERKAHSYFRKRRVESMPPNAREAIAELFNGECAYCGTEFEVWDHFIPVSKGGATVPGNMIPACGSCNSKKRNRDPWAWLQSLPQANLLLVEYLAMAGHEYG